MSLPQPAILQAPPLAARFLTYRLAHNSKRDLVLHRLSEISFPTTCAVGLGAPLLPEKFLTEQICPPFFAPSQSKVSIPVTQEALWISIDGDDHGAALHTARQLNAQIVNAQLTHHFELVEDVLSFGYGGGRDLSGYEDGTENPKEARAFEVACVGAGSTCNLGRSVVDGSLVGSSVVAVQRWVHDLSAFEKLPQNARDAIFGRALQSNEELPDAPVSAHVKRAAQESFDPEAFLLRRSMPWGNVAEHGLYFVAYANTHDPFARILRRMVGAEDGIVDGLFQFSRPVTGGYYWCPPIQSPLGKLHRLELDAVL
jgi:putative iron-dependent peroxidase